MKKKLLKPLCLVLGFVLMLGVLLSTAVGAAVSDPVGVGYSAAHITTALPADAVNILTLAADGSNYPADAKTAYYIEDAAGLVRLSTLVNSSQEYAFSGIKIYLKNDIDMASVTDFVPIGNHTTKEGTVTKVDNQEKANPDVFPDRFFRGIFDGLGHSIKNLTVTSDTRLDNALFGAVRGCVIRNLIIDKSCSFSYTGTSTDARTAALVAFAARNGQDEAYLSEIDNVKAIVLIDNVCNNASVRATTGNTGGIVAGGAAGTGHRLYIRNCTNTGSVSITGNSNGAGGIVARLERFNRGIIIRNCLNTGDVTAHLSAGGIIADHFMDNTGLTIEIIDCENRGNIKADEDAGGILGVMRYSQTKIEGCKNYGEVSGKVKGYCYGLSTHTARGLENEIVVNFVNYHFAGVMLHGYQLGEVKQDADGNARRAIRLVASVDSLDYNAVGFDITASYGDSKSQTLTDRNCTMVYSSLLASDEKGEMVGVTAELLRGKGSYLFALTLDQLAVSIGEITFTVTPYTVTNEVKTPGQAVTFTVDLGSAD